MTMQLLELEAMGFRDEKCNEPGEKKRSGGQEKGEGHDYSISRSAKYAIVLR